MKTSTLTIMLGLVFLFGAAIVCWPKLKDEPLSASSVKSNFPITTKSHEKKLALKEEQKPIVLTFGLKANFENPTQTTNQ